MGRLRTLVLLVVASSGLAFPSSPATYLVRPDGTGDFPTIQAAIDAASSGDTIELDQGVFRGLGNRKIELRGKSLTVRSRSGEPSLCILDGEHAERLFYIHQGEGPGCILEAITLRNGSEFSGGAIYCVSASPTIRNCVFTGNRASYGGAVYT